MEISELPYMVEIPTLRQSCDLGDLAEPACLFCKNYISEVIAAPGGWCNLYPCQHVNTSEEMTCDMFEGKSEKN